MRKNTLCLALALLGLFAADSRAVIVLQSVDWTSPGSTPTSSIGGTSSFGSITGTTAAKNNAGAVFAPNFGSYAFASGYSTSVNEAVALGSVNNATSTQTFTFSQSVSSPYLFFNYTDEFTSFDFGSYNWTLIGATQATRSGSSVVMSPGAGNLASSGFLVQINESFGPSKNLVFDFVDNWNPPNYLGGNSVGFTIAQGAPEAVPEPGTWAAAALLAAGAGYMRLRKRAKVS